MGVCCTCLRAIKITEAAKRGGEERRKHLLTPMILMSFDWWTVCVLFSSESRPRPARKLHFNYLSIVERCRFLARRGEEGCLVWRGQLQDSRCPPGSPPGKWPERQQGQSCVCSTEEKAERMEMCTILQRSIVALQNVP